VIVLFTDFGLAGPYLGQLKAILHAKATGVQVIDLFSDAPVHDPRASAYLLGAYCEVFGEASIFLSIVDPGVGSSRKALVVRTGNRWFVGPDNGLFEVVIRRALKFPAAEPAVECWEIVWKPDQLSASFHGRDLFAPVAAGLAQGDFPSANGGGFEPISIDAVRCADWPDDLDEVIYIDHFGNVITGLRAISLPPPFGVKVAGRKIPRARTFSEVSPGAVFCYENANGLLEIAVNNGRANEVLGLEVGSVVIQENE
jgi:S-adenosylmethionine hydrolase